MAYKGECRNVRLDLLYDVEVSRNSTSRSRIRPLVKEVGAILASFVRPLAGRANTLLR